MFRIYDGREHFWQWDLDRKLIIEDRDIKQVHFCNKTDECSLVCEPYEEAGLWVVDVPNILLQDIWRINVFAYDTNYTKHQAIFTVSARSKPADYVYTETETLNYNTLLERIEELEANPSTGSVEEIHIGTEAPEDKNIKVWINPEEEGTTGGVEALIVNIEGGYNEETEEWYSYASATPKEMVEAQKQGKNVVVVWGDCIYTISYLDECYAIMSYVAPDEDYIYCYYIWEDGSTECWDSDYSRRGVTVYLYSDDEGNYGSTYSTEEIYNNVQNGCNASLEVQEWEGAIFNLSYCAPDLAIFTAMYPDCSEVYSFYIYQDGTVEFYDNWWVNDITLSYNDLYDKPFWINGAQNIVNRVTNKVNNGSKLGNFNLGGKRCYVTFDNVEYVLDAKWISCIEKMSATSSSYTRRVVMGNVSMLDDVPNMSLNNPAPDTGEPFIIVGDAYSNTSGFNIYINDDNPHTLNIDYVPDTAEVHKLSARYISEAIPTVGDIQELVTEQVNERTAYCFEGSHYSTFTENDLIKIQEIWKYATNNDGKLMPTTFYYKGTTDGGGGWNAITRMEKGSNYFNLYYVQTQNGRMAGFKAYLNNGSWYFSDADYGSAPFHSWVWSDNVDDTHIYDVSNHQHIKVVGYLGSSEYQVTLDISTGNGMSFGDNINTCYYALTSEGTGIVCVEFRNGYDGMTIQNFYPCSEGNEYAFTPIGYYYWG